MVTWVIRRRRGSGAVEPAVERVRKDT